MKLSKTITLASIGLIIISYLMIAKKSISKITQKNIVRAADAYGAGYFGAPRGNHIHQGIDIVTIPGESIFAPISGKVTRFPVPYANDSNYSGIEIKNDQFVVKIFYVKSKVKINGFVTQGEVIAISQNIAAKYGTGMTNHAHIEVRTVAGELLDYTKLL